MRALCVVERCGDKSAYALRTRSCPKNTVCVCFPTYGIEFCTLKVSHCKISYCHILPFLTFKQKWVKIRAFVIVLGWLFVCGLARPRFWQPPHCCANNLDGNNPTFGFSAFGCTSQNVLTLTQKNWSYCMVGMQLLPIGHNHWQICWRCQHTLKTLSRFDEEKTFFLQAWEFC